jgi:glycosyltransferase involved in cell wall biosynthesis
VAPVLLLGAGPLPSRLHTRHFAGGLRSRQFAHALADAGLDVELLLLPGAGQEAERETTAAGRPFTVRELTAAELEPAPLRARVEAASPAALVGCGTYPSFLLARCGHAAPLWVDLHGDPLAEGQAAAAAGGGDRLLEEYAWMSSWCLRRGDRFSAVSTPQRYALLGQLGVAGRLNRANAGSDLVRALPDACEVPDDVDEIAEDGPFVLLLTGSFNTWVDGPTLFRALELALPAAPELSLVVTGGEVPGFAETPYREFVASVGTLPAAARARVRLCGWVEDSELERLERTSSCGVVPELPRVERELGSQNRSLRWMARARPLVTTAQCELGAAIRDRGLGLVYPPGDAGALAAAILELVRDRRRARELGARARAWVTRHRSIAATTAPLVDWARDPAPAPDRATATLDAVVRRFVQIPVDQLHLERSARGGGSGDPD